MEKTKEERLQQLMDEYSSVHPLIVFRSLEKSIDEDHFHEIMKNIPEFPIALVNDSWVSCNEHS